MANRELQDVATLRNTLSFFNSAGATVLTSALDTHLMTIFGIDFLHNARIVFGGTPSLATNFVGLIHSIQLMKDQASSYTLSSEASDPGSILFSIQAPTQREGILLHDLVHSHKFRSSSYSTKFDRRPVDHAFRHSAVHFADSHFTDLSSQSGKVVLKRFEAMAAIDSYIDTQFVESWTINNNYAFKAKITNLKYENSPISYSIEQRTFPLYSFEYSIPGTTTRFIFGLYHYVEDQASLPNEGWLQLKFYEVLSDGTLNMISTHSDININFGNR